MRRRFVTLDVFTDRRFAGNPLAVVLAAEGLDTARMQAVAREFNLSETVFVAPPVDAAHRARLRIFTPGAELPFAGHPTVGTAVLLGQVDGGEGGREMIVEEGIGPVRCHVAPRAGGSGFARFELPRLPQPTGVAADPATVAAALGVTGDDLVTDMPPETWSAGVPFTLVALRGIDAVARSRPDMRHWERAFGGSSPSGAFVFSRQPEEPHNAIHARMFAPHLGIAEDPATGAAVAALAGMIARHGRLGDGTHRLGIEQGYEMGRPSQITLSLTLRGGHLVAASIGGDAVVVSEGTIKA